LLACGWLSIKRRNVPAHRFFMGSALLCSAVFLVSYLYYHFQVGSVRFQGQGAARTLYFAILISHTILATAIVPMILRTAFLAWKERFDEHVWWARRTLPLWLYVSVTGVVIYWMLYRL
jgi:putative membrane protein